MRKNLGKLGIALIFICATLFGSEYEWSAVANKKEAFVNEPIQIEYECRFSDQADLYTVDFAPAGAYEDFTLKNLGQTRQIVDGRKINRYQFLLYPKKAKDIKVEFDAIMKKTNKASVEYVIIGRDNNKKQEFVKTIIHQKPLYFHIKESGAPLSGDIALSVVQDQMPIKSFQPYHLKLELKGNLNFDDLKPIAYDISGVKVFASSVGGKRVMDNGKESGAWSQSFVFVSEKNFVIPRREIEFFSLKTNKIEKLAIEQTSVEVLSGYSQSQLLDKPKKSDKWFDIAYVYYLLCFVAGFFIGKIRLKTTKSSNEPLSIVQKIKNASSVSELMVTLAADDAKRYVKLIEKIENESKIELKDAQKMALKEVEI